jgi:hypothetical protein
MVYPPGQGRLGEQLMRLWRDYLEQYAENEGNLFTQVIIGSYRTADVFGTLSLTLDQEGRYREMIQQRIDCFHKGCTQAVAFQDCLVNATFSIYNHLNSLSHQFSRGSTEAENLISQIDQQVQLRSLSASSVQRASAALSAAFPLLSLITLVLDQSGTMAEVIRRVEQRFAAGSKPASGEWDHLLNSLYRLVEMMQVFVTLSDAALRDQVQQISAHFQEEDETPDLYFKLRNGFCRLFELGHLLATHLDGTLT